MVAGDGIYSAHLICEHALSALRTKVDGRFILCSLMCGKTARFERKRAGVCFEFRASQKPLLCVWLFGFRLRSGQVWAICSAAQHAVHPYMVVVGFTLLCGYYTTIRYGPIL